MANSVSCIDLAGETLAQFLAKAVGDATYAAVIDSLKADKSGQAVPASLLTQKAGQIWSNALDDYFKASYPYVREIVTRSIKLDDWAAPDDNTDLNASTGTHGLLPKLSGNSAQYLSGAGTWTTPTPVESVAVYAEAAISSNPSVTSGVAFDALLTADLPEGFAGFITFEFGIAGGSAGTPVGGYTTAGRAILRRATAGSLSVSDTGSNSLGEGTTYSASLAASGNAFRVQITLGTTTTAHVRGWYRIYGTVL